MVGVVVLIIWCAAALLSALWLVYDYKRETAGEQVTSTIRVRYESGAEHIRPDVLVDYINKMTIALQTCGVPADAVAKVMTFNLVVVPWNRIIRTSEIPNGYVTNSKGETILVKGTVEQKTFFFGLVRRTFVYVLQDEMIPESLRRTALAHEIVQHIVPFVREGNWNEPHADEYRKLYADVMKLM